MAYVIKRRKLITLTVCLNPTPPLVDLAANQMNLEGYFDVTKEMHDSRIHTIDEYL